MTLHRRTARPMTQAQSSGDLENTQVQNLAGRWDQAARAGGRGAAGRAALTLVAGAGALRSGRRCWRFGEACNWPSTTRLGSDAPGPVGPGAAGAERAKLGAGVRATTYRSRPPGVGWRAWGRRRPLDRGRDQIQLRETSGDLSGSGSETHQHLSPAGASCCQSLLLDPDARIVIDLREWLFLLVTGQGE
jgi:hypothetical protein